MPLTIATWNINSVRLRMPLVERSSPSMRRTSSACRRPNARTICSRSRRSRRSATSTSRSTARRAITASPSSRAAVRAMSSGGDFCGNERRPAHRRCVLTAGGERSCSTISTSRPAATCPTPRSTRSSRHKLDFLDEMQRDPAPSSSRAPGHPRRRSQRRAARERRLEPQAAAGRSSATRRSRPRSFEAMRRPATGST